MEKEKSPFECFHQISNSKSMTDDYESILEE